MAPLMDENIGRDRQSDVLYKVFIALKHVRKALITMVVYTIYYFYVNYFGIVAFFSLNIFVVLLMTMVFLIWGVMVSLSLKLIDGIDAKMTRFLAGLIIAAFPLILFHFRFDINEAGIYRKVRKYDKQLTQMCGIMLKEIPENIDIPLTRYRQFQIWSPGARPTRQYGYHINGVVYLDFNGSPDDASGLIYNPSGGKIVFHKSNYYHMFGPWYRFNVSHE